MSRMSADENANNSVKIEVNDSIFLKMFASTRQILIWPQKSQKTIVSK